MSGISQATDHSTQGVSLSGLTFVSSFSTGIFSMGQSVVRFDPLTVSHITFIPSGQCLLTIHTKQKYKMLLPVISCYFTQPSKY
uniref:Uncharacterized protein n=1 Tax=Octopus bimaculoides TaxID=37653 RepID=A0A0L8GDY4_OCTBM